jgi:hypothetical protein
LKPYQVALHPFYGMAYGVIVLSNFSKPADEVIEICNKEMEACGVETNRINKMALHNKFRIEDIPESDRLSLFRELFSRDHMDCEEAAHYLLGYTKPIFWHWSSFEGFEDEPNFSNRSLLDNVQRFTFSFSCDTWHSNLIHHCEKYCENNYAEDIDPITLDYIFREVNRIKEVKPEIDKKYPYIFSLMRKRNITGSNYLENAQMPEYLNVDNPNFAPELAIAVQAWMKVYASGNNKANKANKDQIKKWIDSNYETLEGKPCDYVNNLSKECKKRITQIVNPNKAGGAPRSVD